MNDPASTLSVALLLLLLGGMVLVAVSVVWWIGEWEVRSRSAEIERTRLDLRCRLEAEGLWEASLEA